MHYNYMSKLNLCRYKYPIRYGVDGRELMEMLRADWMSGIRDVMVFGKGREQGQGLPCQKTILITASVYFRSFFARWNRSAALGEQVVVYLDEIKLETLRTVLDLCYGGITDFSTGCVFEAIEAASYLGMERIRKLLCYDLHGRSDVPALLWFYNFPAFIADKKLYEKARAYILVNLEKITDLFPDALGQFTMMTWIELLWDDSLFILDENKLFDAVSAWVAIDPVKRSSEFEQIFPNFRLGLLDQRKLGLNLESRPEIVQEIILEIMATPKDEILESYPHAYTPRTVEVLLYPYFDSSLKRGKNWDGGPDGGFVILGANTSFPDGHAAGRKEEVYELSRSPNLAVTCSANRVLFGQFARRYHDRRIKDFCACILGAADLGSSCKNFEAIKEPSSRGSVFCNGWLFVFQRPRQAKKEFICVDITSGEKVDLPVMPGLDQICLNDVSAVAYGFDVFVYWAESYCVLDTLKKTWSRVLPLPSHGIRRSACVGADGNIYLTGVKQESLPTRRLSSSPCISVGLDRYNPREETWKVCASYSGPRHWPNIISLNGSLMLIGGVSNVADNFHETYDPEKDIWIKDMKHTWSTMSSKIKNIFGIARVPMSFFNRPCPVSQSELLVPVCSDIEIPEFLFSE